MSGLFYYVIDTETTGLSCGYHEMTEIGIIRASDRVQLHRCIKCEHPERASYDALRITKKTMADLDRGHNKADIVAECNRFFAEDGGTPSHRVIVAHNSPFDRRFLHALWKSENQAFPANLWLDTIPLTKEYAKKLGIAKSEKQRFDLQSSCDLVGIKKLADAHNAKVDSRNCYLLHRKLAEEKGINYLPFIKTVVHEVGPTINSEYYDDIDMSILDE
jgi:DNA polymerase III epsilon subunit-like protein